MIETMTESVREQRSILVVAMAIILAGCSGISWEYHGRDPWMPILIEHADDATE